jgi:hypothetical protein
VRYVYHRTLRHSTHRDEVPPVEREAAQRLILEAAQA